jgi:hypothetical protein
VKKLLVVTSSVLVAVIGGVAALTFSPAACSCVPVSAEYTRFTALPNGDYVISPGLWQASLWQSLKDQRLTYGQGPLSAKFGCIKSEPHIVDCHLIQEESRLLNRGHDFEYVFNPDGSLRSIRVSKFIAFAR